MKDKSMNFLDNTKELVHQVPAGILLGDNSTEIFGCRKTKKVFAISNGQTFGFSDLNPKIKAQIFQMFVNDEKAMQDLINLPFKDKLEKFTYCVFGGLDHHADFDENGMLKSSDNFICSDDCTCLSWKSKNISVDGENLTYRQIQVLQMLATDKPDKQVADHLNISISTLDTHKHNLFEKFNVSSTKGMITKAVQQKIIQ